MATCDDDSLKYIAYSTKLGCLLFVQALGLRGATSEGFQPVKSPILTPSWI